MSDPLVSVVIPAYNAAPFIRHAIDSVLAQTWKELEILVVDDGSTDETASVVSNYAPPVRLLQKANGGLSSARNRGIRASKGDLVAFLDADDYWLPEKIEHQASLLANHPEIGFCSTKTRVEDENGNIVNYWSCPQQTSDLLKSIFMENGIIPGSGSGVMIRKTLFEQTGLFDERLRSLEDIDMWMRLAAITKYACIDQPLTVIIKRKDSMSKNLQVMRDSAMHVLKKNRHLLPREDQETIWKIAVAGMLSDYAKWEYREGNRLQAITHILHALYLSPRKEATWKYALLLSMIMGKTIQ